VYVPVRVSSALAPALPRRGSISKFAALFQQYCLGPSLGSAGATSSPSYSHGSQMNTACALHLGHLASSEFLEEVWCTYGCTRLAEWMEALHTRQVKAQRSPRDKEMLQDRGNAVPHTLGLLLRWRYHHRMLGQFEEALRGRQVSA